MLRRSSRRTLDPGRKPRRRNEGIGFRFLGAVHENTEVQRKLRLANPATKLRVSVVRVGRRFVSRQGACEMTKADLIDDVSRRAELTRKDSEVIVETIFESVVRSLGAGDKIEKDKIV